MKQTSEDLGRTADEVIELAKLSLLFGRTLRATFHEDGVRPETDTDHTVMLSLVACGLAEKYYPALDVGLVAQFSMVHDLVEAYAGDTPTLKINANETTTKEAREKLALERLSKELGASFPIIPRLLERYEERLEPEARFVKAVDKILPKATHILNHGASLRAQGIKKQEAKSTYDKQREDMRAYASDFPAILELRQVLVGRMMSGLPE